MDTVVEAGDLGDLLEARRRIVAAFEGIAAGAEALAARAAEAEALDRLRAELDEERVVNAQLQERIRSLREREDRREREGSLERDSARAALEEEVARLRAELDDVRASAEAERRELDAVLAELIPLVEEAR